MVKVTSSFGFRFLPLALPVAASFGLLGGIVPAESPLHTKANAFPGVSQEIAQPKDITQLWKGYDPTALPLDVEVTKDWIEDGIRFQKVYFTAEIWEGEPVRVFAYTGVPVGAQRVPGILHIHGGGQTAYLEWVKY